MIGDLDETLKSLLLREMPFFETSRIRFETPDRDFQPSLPAVNLFLYDVRENLELRSNATQTIRGNGTATQQRAPVRIDCSYLITAWAGDIRDEHMLLGEIMRILLRYAKLPEEVLHGVLKDQDLPLPTSVLQPGHLQSVGEFWQALDGKPRATLNYTVTVAVQPFGTTTVPLVVDSRGNFGPMPKESTP